MSLPQLFVRRRSWGGASIRGLVVAAFLALAAPAFADLADAQALFRSGDYAKALASAETALRDGATAGEEWQLLRVQSLLAVGRYADADAAMIDALKREAQSIRLLWLAREVAFRNGQPVRAKALSEGIARLFTMRSYAYRDAASLVIFGRVALLLENDPRDVLEKIYSAATKIDPNSREVLLAKGELALEKHDLVLAGSTYEEALKKFSDDPDFYYGLARAHEDGDRKQSAAALEAALRLNPRHTPALLMQAEGRIDAEDYAGAAEALAAVLAINPRHPDAFAYRAVLAHLRNDPAGERSARADALRDWAENPRVDFLIGEKLAQKYRFAEAAARQRQALTFDSNYLPAKIALANALLRLGDEPEGWRLVREVNTKDGYDVSAFNLVSLHDAMAKYVSVTNDDFVIRMTAHEAEVYGARVQALLGRAKERLTKKYGVELPKPVYIEIFADPKDFAVRTFGMPDIGGFLGVCFGRVVTANSPASSAGKSVNWEAVLWHEFCHVVTLTATHNKMPRWLSEGISVYEERQGNPSWGEQLGVRYREMILGKDLTPVGALSGAFLSPKSGEHLQFAYYEASLVVQFLIERHGIDALRAILADLGLGVEINAALAARAAPLAKLESDFAAYARDRANDLAPKLDWTKPDADLLLPAAEAEFAAWAKLRPNNYYALRSEARRLMADKKWAEAKTVLLKLTELFPAQRGEDSAWRLLAAAHRALGDTIAERDALATLAMLDDAAADAYQRLIEIATEAKDWPVVAKNAQRALAVNPLVPAPWRALAEASAATDAKPIAIGAWETVLKLDPANPADVHFRLAQLLNDTGAPGAKRHLLQALEDTPRDREALKLLLEFDAAPAAATAPVTPKIL